MRGAGTADVRQVKGLEFDYVVVLGPTRQNYPITTPSRHLLHIAVTRALAFDGAGPGCHAGSVHERSRAVVWAWLLAAACGREPRPENPAAAASPVVAGDVGTKAGNHAWTPWGIAREREQAILDVQEEAEAEARRAQAQLERKLGQLEREAAELEAELERKAAATHSPAATPLTPAPMSRSEPAPAPMSRPEPTPIAVSAPPFAYTLGAAAPVAHQGPQPKLEQRSAKRNGIIDTEAWFLTHGLALPTWALPHRPTWSGSPVGTGDPLPPEVLTTLAGNTLSQAIRGSDHNIAIYSSPTGSSDQVVTVFDPFGDSLGAFEISAWPLAQAIHWAQVEDGVLYLCTYHMTYASSTGGKNAFLTALALPSGELLWQSEPLVCNTQDFLLRDGWILSGYGFTAEPDFLFVLDMKTGAVVQRKKLASGPEVILEKGGTLFVRTYDRDYEFAIR